MKDAMLYERLAERRVKCNLCSRRCVIPESTVGFCKVRRNVEGTLESLVYARACAANIDPIEKKPLWHFHPGSLVMSIATVGCNFRCKFCQNWEISQESEMSGESLPPEQVVELAKRQNCVGISYTYTEPTIFFEYAYDTAKLAHQEGLFNTFVTNGYMTSEAVEMIAPFLDAATVDFKGAGDRDFYREFSSVPSVEPVYECLQEMKRHNIHVEITNLVVPKIGDSMGRIRELAGWIKTNLGEDTPFHLLAFRPEYKVTDLPSTPVKTIEQACQAAREEGLHYVYAGNIPGHRYENTYCPKCGALLIERFGFSISTWNLTAENKCAKCGITIPIKGSYTRRSATW
jgi:pyruvate formate lyase activating enzyme